TRGQLHARADLQDAIARRPAPLRRLRLPDAEPIAERLLANCAANRTGEHARLDARDAQRPFMLDGAPQALPGRDRQPQLRPGDLVRCRALSTRTPLRQIMRDPYRAIEVVALEVVSEAHEASIPSARATTWFVPHELTGQHRNPARGDAQDRDLAAVGVDRQ